MNGRYRFHIERRRSWLEVSIEELARLGIEAAISPTSRIDAGRVFLDEQQDFGMFAFAKAAYKEAFDLDPVYYGDDDAPISGYLKYPANKLWREAAILARELLTPAVLTHSREQHAQLGVGGGQA